MPGMNFFIPDYQRGYRWSASEAEQMLNDLKQFCKRKKEEEVNRYVLHCKSESSAFNKTKTLAESLLQLKQK